MIRKIFWLLSFLPMLAMAQQKDLSAIALKPFWEGKIMYDESVLMISKDGKPAEATLLFKPKRILSVRNAGLDVVYKKNVDWEFRDGKLRLLPGSKAIFMIPAELYPDSVKRVFLRKGGGNILHQEGAFFHNHQLAVTYKHARNAWKGIVPSFAGDHLPQTMQKLRGHLPLRILLFGDSIASGANASAKSGAAPNLPDWGPLIVEKLKKFYGTEISFTNTAVGGKDSEWGKETVAENVNAHDPDLVIIAFGMNDGTGKMAAQVFKDNIKKIIDSARSKNPKAEFILVSTMLPNPESFFLGTQPEFKAVLQELTGAGIALVDITEVHRELLKYKSYQDMTGNNINHPNDFLIRWYAQEIAGILIP